MLAFAAVLPMKPSFWATALITVLPVTWKRAVKAGEVATGSVPSVVKRIVAPGVALEINTHTGPLKLPPGGVIKGAASSLLMSKAALVTGGSFPLLARSV